MNPWVLSVPVQHRWNILVVGDSHMQSLLSGLKNLAFDYNFDLYPMPAVSAKMFVTDREKFDAYLARVENFKADLSIIMFGGGDCEFIAPLKYTKNINPFAYVEKVALEYANFLNNNMKTPMLVIGALPPVLTDEKYFNVLIREYKKGLMKKETGSKKLAEIMIQLQKKPPLSHETRIRLHEHFNNVLRVNLKHHKFLSLSHLVTSEFNRNDDHHLLPTANFLKNVSSAFEAALRCPFFSDTPKTLKNVEKYVESHQEELESEGKWLISHMDPMESFGTNLAEMWKVLLLRLTYPTTDKSQRIENLKFQKDIPHIYQVLSQCDYINAWISMLPANTNMNAHVGYASLSEYIIRCHIPLVVEPEASGVCVNGVIHYHKKGSLFVFDDTFIHFGFNTSKEARLVLIIDIRRPLLTLPPSKFLPNPDESFLTSVRNSKSLYGKTEPSNGKTSNY